MKMRKGFTLIELLIVIIIIGILAAAMLLSTGSATSAAKASTIISDLRNMKAAAAMLVLDSDDAFGNAANTPAILLKAMSKYADNPDKYTKTNSDFAVVKGSGPLARKAFGGFKVGGAADVKVKLQEKAKEIGLFGSANATTAPTDITKFSKNEAYVWMLIY